MCDLDLKQYQEGCSKNFKEHTELSAESARLLNWAIGLGGEAGEVAELIKHSVFGGAPINKMEVAKELGDVIWYVSAMATFFNINLEDIFMLNMSKLDHRYADGYTDKENMARHEAESKFEDTEIYKELKKRIVEGGEEVWV